MGARRPGHQWFSRPRAGLRERTGESMPSWIRQCVACLLAGVIPFASSGITPVWICPARQSAIPSDSGEWFPCRDHGCGCQNAETCRTRCCCRRTVVAPPPRPAARSCCTHEEVVAQQPAVSTTPPRAGGLRPVFQSPECGGRDAFGLIKSSCWVVQYEPIGLHPPTDQGTLDTAVTVVNDQINLSPEPPPPRAC